VVESGAGTVASAAAGKKRRAEGGAYLAGGWTLKEELAVKQACEATKGQRYEVAYEEYKRITPRSICASIKKAEQRGPP
jgi:hypothetical protein